MNARKSVVNIKYNGKNVTDTITDYIEGFDYTDNASGKADSVTIKLNNRSGKWSGKWKPLTGDYIQPEIQLTNWTKEGDNRKLKCGSFLIDDIDYSGPPDVASLGWTSTPINTDFNVTEKTHTWKKTSVKGILTEYATRLKIGLFFSGKDYSIDELEQSNQTDITFAFNTCSSYNKAMKLYDNKIVVFDMEEYEKAPAALTITKQQCDTWDFKVSLTRFFDGVSISYTDSDKNNTLNYTYNLQPGNRIMKVNETADSLQDAEIKAKAKLSEHNRQCQTVTLKLKGDVKYISSKCVNLKGFGDFDGKYYVDTVKHQKNTRSGYQCTIDAHLCVTTEKISDKKVKAKKKTETSGKTYTVVSGDTLIKISESQLGSGAKYMQIYNANKDLIEQTARQHGYQSSESGRFIFPGTVLNIPN